MVSGTGLGGRAVCTKASGGRTVDGSVCMCGQLVRRAVAGEIRVTSVDTEISNTTQLHGTLTGRIGVCVSIWQLVQVMTPAPHPAALAATSHLFMVFPVHLLLFASAGSSDHMGLVSGPPLTCEPRLRRLHQSP